MFKRTPLYKPHRALGARMIEFGGWQMPVHYSGILAEHRAVCAQVGLFGLSHMGEIELSGPRALEVCQEPFVIDVARIQITQAQYTPMCLPQGGIVDDVIVYRLAEDRYFLCVNAANADTDYDWIVGHNRGRAEIINHSDAYALIALQGPRSEALLCQLTALDLLRFVVIGQREEKLREYPFSSPELDVPERADLSYSSRPIKLNTSGMPAWKQAGQQSLCRLD